MTREVSRSNRPVSDQLHPLVYAAIVGLVLWYVISAWDFFGEGDTGLLLAVVSSFFVMATAIPCVLWLVWRKHRGSGAEPGEGISLRDWASGSFEIWQDRLKGANAIVEILLPIAAVALGMTALGIVFHYTVANAVYV
jgi:hypothetical protein